MPFLSPRDVPHFELYRNDELVVLSAQGGAPTIEVYKTPDDPTPLLSFGFDPGDFAEVLKGKSVQASDQTGFLLMRAAKDHIVIEYQVRATREQATCRIVRERINDVLALLSAERQIRLM